MSIRDVFRITHVPDTAIYKDRIESDIEVRCREIRDKLLGKFPVLNPYQNAIYVRRGETVPGGTPAYAVIIGESYVMLSVRGLRDHFDSVIEWAGLNLREQLRAPAMA